MTMNLSLVAEWEHGLPRPDELTPLSQGLIPQELASAFNIPHSSSPSAGTEGTPSSSDVLNASQSAFESLFHMRSVLIPTLEVDEEGREEAVEPMQQRTPNMAVTGFTSPLKEVTDQNGCAPDAPQGKLGMCMAGASNASSRGLDYGGSLGHGISMESTRVLGSIYSHRVESSGVDVVRFSEDGRANGDVGHGVAMETASLMQLRLDPGEEVDSGPSVDTLPSNPASLSCEEQSARTLKKPRLVWTPQLHKRFVDAVAHLGIKNAVPKTIMQLMNVEGLTRENVASHLQKYRLYLKRMQGLSTEGPSPSDHLFATTPVPPGLTASGHFLGTRQHTDYRLATAVPGVNLPILPGPRGHHLMSSPITSFTGFDGRTTFSGYARAPPQTLIRHEPMREAYNQHSNSPTGSVLTLFPTSGS